MITSDWTIVERPGYFGKRRGEKHREYDQRYGVGGWQIGWQWGSWLIEATEVVLVYEDSYFCFLEANQEVLAELCAEAADVYDDAPSNVASSLDYLAQETARTHLQDVAIRRCLIRLSTWFQGSELIQIRDKSGEHPLSLTLSPGRIPFHRPDLIVQPELAGWWLSGSVESFYQSNKALLIRP